VVGQEQESDAEQRTRHYGQRVDECGESERTPRATFTSSERRRSESVADRSSSMHASTNSDQWMKRWIASGIDDSDPPVGPA
jgi:hypothetical protein